MNSDSEEEEKQIVHHDHLEKGVASNDDKEGDSKAAGSGHEEVCLQQYELSYCLRFFLSNGLNMQDSTGQNYFLCVLHRGNVT